MEPPPPPPPSKEEMEREWLSFNQSLQDAIRHIDRQTEELKSCL